MSEPSRRPTTDPDDPVASVSDWGSTLAVNEGWLRRVVASRLGEPQAVDEVMQDVALAAVAQRSPCTTRHGRPSGCIDWRCGTS